MSQPVHLDDDVVASLLDPDEVTATVEAAFTAWGSDQAATTQRVRAMTSAGMASGMAAVVPPFSGGKVYATRNGVFTFVVVLFDLDGNLLCTLDGDVLTQARTPAASAIAIRRLAAPDAEIAALVGTGRQSWAHTRMLAAELPNLRELRIAGVVPEQVAALLERARAAGIPAVAATDADAAATDAHVIVTITQSPEPVFSASSVADHALVCAVGATKYDRCEIPPELVGRCAAVVCDDVVGSRVECGDLIRAAAEGHFDWSNAIEFHAVCAGRAEVARAGSAPVLFETQGVALQDVAVAGLAWQRFTATRS
ncbi:MAG: hypothetical protein R2715_23995 [Ilumatobacteraceae bacterium]